MADPVAPPAETTAVLRDRLLGIDDLVRAVASGRRRGSESPWRRLEARYVDLKGGRHLQVTMYDERQAFTTNHAVTPEVLAPAVDALVAGPFANWHVESRDSTLQVRFTKKDRPLVHEGRREEPLETSHAHDRAKVRLLADDDPLFVALGLADSQGKLKPSRQAKYRQVEEFVRALDVVLAEAFAAGGIPTPTHDRPLQVVDLGCGNAYLTFAAYRYLSAVRGIPVRVVGVDVKQQSLDHGTAVAAELGVSGEVRFTRGSIGSATLDQSPDVVLALHACDTATDDALAQAVGWEAPLILAAPCCHHDVAAQLRARQAAGEVPAELRSLVRDGILRERFADTLTDAVRADALREQGYRVEVVEFVESRHTPRNTLLRAVRTGASRTRQPGLVEQLGLRPRIRELLG